MPSPGSGDRRILVWSVLGWSGRTVTPVSRAQLEQVWKTTTQAANGVWGSSVYAEFLAAVRDVNSWLPADACTYVGDADVDAKPKLGR